MPRSGPSARRTRVPRVPPSGPQRGVPGGVAGHENVRIRLLLGLAGWAPYLWPQRRAECFGLCQIVEQFLCHFEIGGREPFGKSIVNREEECRRVGGTILIVQQPGKAHGGAQFPGERALPACPVERLPKVILRCRRSLGAVTLKYQLAFDAQEFGQIPAFITRFATRHG